MSSPVSSPLITQSRLVGAVVVGGLGQEGDQTGYPQNASGMVSQREHNDINLESNCHKTFSVGSGMKKKLTDET